MFYSLIGDVAIALTDERGMDVPVNTIDNQDGTFTMKYTAQIPGTYTVNVYFADKEIPTSPIKVKVESSIDIGKVKVEGLGKSKYLLSLRSESLLEILVCLNLQGFRFDKLFIKIYNSKLVHISGSVPITVIPMKTIFQSS